MNCVLLQAASVLHCVRPTTAGTRIMLIAFTIGQHRRLKDSVRKELETLGLCASLGYPPLLVICAFLLRSVSFVAWIARHAHLLISGSYAAALVCAEHPATTSVSKMRQLCLRYFIAQSVLVFV